MWIAVEAAVKAALVLWLVGAVLSLFFTTIVVTAVGSQLDALVTQGSVIGAQVALAGVWVALSYRYARAELRATRHDEARASDG